MNSLSQGDDYDWILALLGSCFVLKKPNCKISSNKIYSLINFVRISLREQNLFIIYKQYGTKSCSIL